MSEEPHELRPIGRVDSPLRELDDAPAQGDEGAPDCWLTIEPHYADGLADLEAGTTVVVLTWLDRARRDVLTLHPRGDPRRRLTGVFSTRSPDRPNPIGLHNVRVIAVEDNRVHVADLEVFDGTPVLDIKPTLGPIDAR